jgi:isocitrate dehydrogenase (NAD+)
MLRTRINQNLLIKNTTASFSSVVLPLREHNAAGSVYGGKYTVTLIPGDGVGVEMAESVKNIFKSANVPVEWEQYNLSGEVGSDTALFKQAMNSVRRNKVALKGILFTPTTRHGAVSWNVKLRKDLDIYASVALLKNFETSSFPVKHKGVDIAIIRENTEGEYSGMEHMPVPGVVESLKVVTKTKTERIAKFAFDFALKNKRKTVTAIHKANIMKLGDGLFLNTCREVSKLYEPYGIKFNEMIVDNAAMQFVSKPQQFDVVVCGNLYGNILTNVGAGLIGGPGIIPGVNVGRDYCVFEPGCRHVGKDLQGKNKANPTSLILSSIQMLRHLNLEKHAELIEKALLEVIKEGKFVTMDLGGNSSSTDFTNEMIRKIQL